MMRSIVLGVATALVVGAAALPAAADNDWRDHDRHEHHDHDHDRNWRRGAWWHGNHHGRVGWWWIVGDNWYYYPVAVYPYPQPGAAPPPAQAPIYYWCDNPRGYYPAVPACATPWRIVPAAPPG
jgi:hypothetical protein